MDQRTTTTPDFDWHAEQNAQKRDQSRFTAELGRVLSLRGGSPTAREAAARLRERWDHLVRRLEGRWARGGDVWDRQVEAIERLKSDRTVLEALVEYDEQLAQGDLDSLLRATLRVIEHSLAATGAMIVLADIGGQPRAAASERRRGRFWPPAADRELAELVAAAAREGRRTTIEGRPVKSGLRDPHRVAQWLGVAIAREGESYGAIVIGRSAAEEAFTEDNAEVLERIGRHMAGALAARVGVGVRPTLGSGPKPEGFEHLWGECPALRRAIALANRYSLADSPVVLEGEMGTGRETLARAIHLRSRRAASPFVVFRGGDLPEEVVARGLFGATTTGADARLIEQPGDLEVAHGGTLFIDDLRSLYLLLQVRLLRFLREQTYERVGDRTARQADVRIMIASTEDLESAVARGQLRSDLYYEITAARVTLPPLRERGGDIVELARRFAAAAGTATGKRIDGIDAEAARLLAASPFPGNVRQLEQVIERAVFLASGPLIGAADLPREIAAHVVAPTFEGTAWGDQALRAARLAQEAGQSGDWRQFGRARQMADGALAAAFVQAVTKTVGRHAARAARHCGIHRAQWWRLSRQVQPAAPGATRDTPDTAGHDKNRTKERA
ncbi:MAG: sigma 54-interacting transcriptional regulator [Candidatus Zixiibacteriota bacterium]